MKGERADGKEPCADSGTAAALFEFAIAGEQAAEDFYDGLAGKFGHEAAVSDFWKTMASDERRTSGYLMTSGKHSM